MNIGKQIQKGMGVVLALVLTAPAAHAAFTSINRVAKTATATLVGTGSVAFDLVVRQASNNAAATDVTWTGVTLPTGWKNADHYLQLNSTVTASNGGIRIVTDNKGTGASPAYTGSNTTAGGLIDNTDPSKALPLAWTIKDGVAGSTGPVSAKPFEVADGAGQNDQFQWLFMTDVVDTSLAPDAAYRTAVNSIGIHFDGSNTGFGAAGSPNFVYLEANFSNAVTPRTYSTNKLTVEAFTQ